MRPVYPSGRPAVLSVALLVAPVESSLPLEGRQDAPEPARALEVEVELPGRSGDPARLRARSGTFETRPENVELLRRALAGERGEWPVYAAKDGSPVGEGAAARSPRR